MVIATIINIEFFLVYDHFQSLYLQLDWINDIMLNC